MASSPAGRQNIYSNSRDYPGCMGGLMHLFDFNQALAGRKMLTDQKSGSGLGEATHADVGGTISEMPKPHTERRGVVPNGHEIRTRSAPRKSTGMPIRALIAQDLTKELDGKNRSPSVVARLMGLEALPPDFKSLAQERPAGSTSGKADEKFMQRRIVDKLHHEENATHRGKTHVKKSKTSSIFSQIAPRSSSSRHIGQDRNEGLDAPGLKHHPQEQQLQEFKKEFEAWQTQKSRDHLKGSSKLENSKAWTPRHQSLPNQTVNIQEERLRESKEFQDALDFLQSNKEFFMRFLHEPNSLFARHLQEVDSESPVEIAKGIKHRHAHQGQDCIQSPRPPSWSTDSPSSRRFDAIDGKDDPRPLSWSNESPFSRSPRGGVSIEKGILNLPCSPTVKSEKSTTIRDQRSYPASPMSSQSRSHHQDCQVPTRIVVLKPSPGRVRNVNSTKPAYVSSPNDQIAFDTFKDDNTDVLERLREKLRKDSISGYNKSEGKNGIVHINEQYRNSSKDPREIAREIARQVRENITRDLMVDPRFVQSGARKRALGRKQSQFTDPQGNASFQEGEESRRFTRTAHWDSQCRPPRSPMKPDKIFGFEVMRSTIAQKVDMIEQVKQRVSDNVGSQLHDFGMRNVGLERNNSHGASQRHFSTGSSKSRKSFKVTADGLFGNDIYDGSSFPHCNDHNGDPFGSHSALVGKQNNIVERSERNLSEAMPCFDLEGSEFVPEGKVCELAEKVGPDVTVCNEVMHAERPMLLKNESEDLTVSDARLVGCNDVRLTKSSQTNLMMEGPDEPCDEVRGAEKKLPSDAEVSEKSSHEWHSPPRNHSEDDPVTVCVDDLTDVDSSLLHGTSVEPLELPVSHDIDCLDSVCGEVECEQVLMIDQNHFSPGSNQVLNPKENNCQAIVESTPAHTSAIALTTCKLDDNIEHIKEQPEQPSPVSVLDLPYEEDASIATEFKELSSDLEELRMRLDLLSFDTSSLGNNQGMDAEPDHESQAENIHSIVTDDCTPTQSDDNDLLGNAPVNVADWEGENSDRCYIRDLLAASGLLGDSSSVLTHWYAPGQPLNPCLYQNLERACSHEGKEEISRTLQKSSSNEVVLGVTRRHLLFDCANEVLLDVLGPSINKRMWSCFKSSPSMPTGKDLVDTISGRITYLFDSHSGAQETLESLVTRDLGSHGSWLDVGAEIEARGSDVERAILDDLIEETLLVL